jgi:ribosomal protein S18 acetylase RimI-like enzyme
MDVRAAEPGEIGSLARIWYEAWQDAHARILPAELARHRTLESFRERLEAALPSVRVVGEPGEPVGFCMIKDDELYQLFVSSPARGSGVAASLLVDAEVRLARRGVATAWLACAIGNERAARFYEKCGWHRAGTVVSQLETPSGIFPLDVWRYEKQLRPAWHTLLGQLPTDAVPVRQPVAPPEVLASPTGWAVAGWEHLVLHLSAGASGSRTILVVLDASGTLLSGSDSILYYTAPPAAPPPIDDTAMVHIENVGGRFEPDGSFRGTRWHSVAVDRPEDEEVEWESTRNEPTAEDVSGLRMLTAELIRRQPPKE